MRKPLVPFQPIPYPPPPFWHDVRMVLAEGEDTRRERDQLRRIVQGFSVPGKEGRYLATQGALHAYVRAFLPYELPKIPLLLKQARPLPSPLLRTGGELTVADCGAGPGTASLGLLCFLGAQRAMAKRPVTLLLCERESKALRIAEKLITWLSARLDLRVTTRMSRKLLPDSPVDLLLMQNVLSEACATLDKASEVLVKAIDTARTIVIVEPADRHRSRRLHAARDRLIAARRVALLGPCTHENPCPALSTEGDWCSCARPWLPPREARLGLREGTLPRRRLKCSYLICEQARDNAPRTSLRALTGVRRLAGRYEVQLCGKEGKDRYRLLKRRLTTRNASLRKIRTGDLVAIDPSPKRGSGFRDLERDSRVTIYRL